jgi:mRNA interferase MazF
MPNVKRGDVVYVTIPYATGHEMQKDRPGIVVSCDELNLSSPCVTVVLCTASVPKKELPEHVRIRSTPITSTAMCEHICTVDKSRIERVVGHCNENEIQLLDIAMMCGLKLDGYLKPVKPKPVTPAAAPEPVQPPAAPDTNVELVRAEAERDVYKTLYTDLLARMSIDRKDIA